MSGFAVHPSQHFGTTAAVIGRITREHGVPMNGINSGSASVLGLPSVTTPRTAVPVARVVVVLVVERGHQAVADCYIY
jgi:hypothetical protein